MITRVVITGFMAAGKTTVAGALASRLGCEMLDTDDLIRERTGRTPAEIIDAEGEARFREIESGALRDALTNSPPAAAVIALGGGAWSVEANRELINARGCLTVWLDAPYELCRQRIDDAAPATAGAPDRPNARDPERARSLYDARRADYQLARLRVRVRGGESVGEIADEIARALTRGDAPG